MDIKTKFSDVLVGRLHEHPYTLIKEKKNIAIKFPWTWKEHKCSKCGNTDREVTHHDITKVQVWSIKEKLEDPELEKIKTEVWIALTRDERTLFIPKDMRRNLALQLGGDF